MGKEKNRDVDLIGLKFKPTFESNIAFFEIHGYNDETDIVHTIVHCKNGYTFTDCIEREMLFNGIEIGEYKWLIVCKSNH